MARATRPCLLVLLSITSITNAWEIDRRLVISRVVDDSFTQVVPTTTSPSATLDSNILEDASEILDGLKDLPVELTSSLSELQDAMSKLKTSLDRLLHALGLGGRPQTSTFTSQPASTDQVIGLPVGFPTVGMPASASTMLTSSSPYPSPTRHSNASSSTSDLRTTRNLTSTIHITRTVRTTVITVSPSPDPAHATTTISTLTDIVSPEVSGNPHSFVGPNTMTSSVPTAQSRPFDPHAQNNVAVYYDMWTAPDRNTSMDSMQLLCDEPAIDIVNLAWVQTFVGPQYAPAPGYGIVFPCAMINCTAIGYQASLCQSKGKKVFVSLVVNATHSVSSSAVNSTNSDPSSLESYLSSGEWATGFASGILSTFGPSVSTSTFGTLEVDGFDIFPESPTIPLAESPIIPRANSTNLFLVSPYDVQLIKALRQQMSTLAKTYYISAAPYCGASQTPIGLEALRQVDFVYVRYFDAIGCSLQDPSLDLGASLHQWSSDLLGLTNGTGSTPAEFPGPGSSSTVDNGPRLFFGALAPNGSADVDNITVSRWESLYRYVNPTNMPDQGGVMLWGTPEDVERKGRTGRTFAAYAKGQVGCLDKDFRAVPCHG